MIRYTVGATVQLDVERGDTETFYVTWEPGGVAANLTGYTAEFLDSDYAAIPAAVSIPVPANGQVKITFSPAQTLAMTDKYFRLRVVQAGFKQTLLEGRINAT